MFADYLTRGVTAGLIAGVAFGLFVVVASPVSGVVGEANHAAGDAGPGHEPGDGHGGQGEGQHAVAPTAVDAAVSVVAGVLWGVLLGVAVFGVGGFFLEPSIPGTGATRSYALGGAGFVTVSGAPWLVLPPVAPGAEGSVPVATRLPLYAGMMVAGAVACLLAGAVYRRLRESNGGVAAVGALLPFGLLAVPAALAPTNALQAVLGPGALAGPTAVVVLGQVLLWLVLAATHARLASTARSQGPPSRPDPAGRAD